jgi:uncharacterized membrane protein
VEKLVLSVHVLAAILTVGPVTIAAWLFVRAAAADAAKAADRSHSAMETRSLGFLHRVSVVGAVAALSVPVFGVATAIQLDVLGDAWLIVAIALTGCAALVFLLGVLGGQRRVLAGPAHLGRPARRGPDRALVWSTTAFTVLWMVVVTLMVFRPGSTAGVAA